ncbi:Hypothetical protein POVN_LOCUS571 [uncultured virus]|nr:Hypothetical protein POVN_LOCUS571 [uncultured virus]
MLMSVQASTDKPLSYQTIACESKLRSADQIITRWSKDRHQLARAVTSGAIAHPTKDILAKSGTCACQMSKKRKAFVDNGACVGCDLLSRLFRNGEITTATPFVVQVGAFTGHRFVAKNFKGGLEVVKGFAGYEETSYPAKVGAELLQLLSSMQACETSFSEHIKNTVFWACKGSQVEHYMTVSSFMENELNKARLPTTPVFRWAFMCQDDIDVVDEVPSLSRGTLAEITSISEYIETPRSPTARSSPTLPLTNETMRGLLRQLISTLKFFSGYVFTHGSPSLHSLGFSKTPAAYIYDDVKVTSPVGLHVIPSGTSSFSAVKPDGTTLRLYHPGTSFHTSVDYKMLPRITVAPCFGYKGAACGESKCVAASETTVPCLAEYASLRVITYKIGASPAGFAKYVQHLGIPLFYSSFDVYAFWMALMCEEAFYLAVQNDTQILRIWKQLFLPDEYDALMADVRSLRQRTSTATSPSSEELLERLAKYHLRCDALEHTWQLLKAL